MKYIIAVILSVLLSFCLNKNSHASDESYALDMKDTSNVNTVTCISTESGEERRIDFISGKDYIYYEGDRYREVGSISHDVQGIVMYRKNKNGFVSIYVGEGKIAFSKLDENDVMKHHGECKHT